VLRASPSSEGKPQESSRKNDKRARLVTFAKSIKLHKRPGQDELTIQRHPGIRDIEK